MCADLKSLVTDAVASDLPVLESGINQMWLPGIASTANKAQVFRHPGTRETCPWVKSTVCYIFEQCGCVERQ